LPPGSPGHLFVYGTLRRGSNNRFARLLAAGAQFTGPARVPGKLYDFGQYPGARRSHEPAEIIAGEVFRLDEPGELLAALDDYEGAEFERAMAPALLDDGRTIECWIYWYVGPTAGRAIASGDWSAKVV
jgi:gamma-glutamylcyclotransferase (GGCT)/AIG2-like uncharacterized protein YtfP